MTRTSAPPAPTVSVVICCYTTKRWALLVEAVESLRTQTSAPMEILVVVDHCHPLYQRVRRQLPGVRALVNEGPAGLSAARNTGLAASSGDVVAFLDDDAVAEPNWLAMLLAGYSEPEVLGVGGHVTPAWADGRPSWFPPEFDWVVGGSHPGLPAVPGPVRNFVGANMSFRRAMLAEIGGFRADLGRVGTKPVGCEETELCIRASAHAPNGVLRYQPAAAVRHHVSRERGTWAYFRSRCYAEGLSKASVARIAGAGAALSTERDYVYRVLPRGFARALAEGAGRRAATLVSGLALTCAGYAVGRYRNAAIQLLPLVLALLGWAFSLRSVPLRNMTDLGLVSVLPATYWVALAVITGRTVQLIHADRASGHVLGAHLAGLIVVLHATPTLLYDSLRYPWAWKHVGIVDFIVRHGAVDPQLDTLTAYHAWPGFFALNALLTQGAGLPSALPYAGWAPPVFALLALIPLRVLFGTLVGDRRQVWLAMLIFYLANWVGQEYFAPQAFAFLLNLVVLVVCLRLLPARNRGPLPRWRRPFGGELPGQVPVASGRWTLVALVLLLMLAIVSSHQLTPFMLLSALTVLVAGRHTGPAWLPWLLGALTFIWIYLMAGRFLHQNLYWILESIGRPAANTQTTLVDLSMAGFGQRLVSYTDRGLTVGLALLAAAGAARAWRRGTPWRVPALLAFVPLPMLVANSYGGEMLFRVYLFASPFLALLAAGLIYPRRSTRIWGTLFPGSLVLLLTAAFCLAYYGKERANYFTTEEVAASTWLYDHAPAGSLVIAATSAFPWAFTHYEDYRYRFLEDLPPGKRTALASAPVAVLTREIGSDPATVYVIITRAQQVSARYTGSIPPGASATMTTALNGAAGFRPVYRNTDAVIFERAPGGTP